MDHEKLPVPDFLDSLSHLVHRLVRGRSALYVDEDTVAEFVLLAGLPWKMAPQQIQPCDFALAWLKLSHVPVWTSDIDGGTFSTIDNHQITGKDMGRSAECAELAAIANYWLSGNRWKPSFDGTLEGACAAWEFIACGPLTVDEAIPIIRSINEARAAEKKMDVRAFHAFAVPIIDRYRQELAVLLRAAAGQSPR